MKEGTDAKSKSPKARIVEGAKSHDGSFVRALKQLWSREISPDNIPSA